MSDLPTARSPRPSRRAPRVDVVRSMLADRDSRSTPPGAARNEDGQTAGDRRRLWQERLADYVRHPPTA